MDSVFSVPKSEVFFKLTAQFSPRLLPGVIPQNPRQQKRQKQFKVVPQNRNRKEEILQEETLVFTENAPLYFFPFA